MIKKIESDHLNIGMYVNQLDRPYLETPFLSHKFFIKTPKQIDQLRKYCRYVYIDTEKGMDIDPVQEVPRADLVENAFLSVQNSRKKDDKTSTLGDGEIHRALEVHNQAQKVIGKILEDVRLGESIKTAEAKQAVNAIVNSLIEDQNALLCFSQLKTRDEYTAFHSINVSILSVAFGKQLGLSVEELQILGLGGLLHDIGKMRIPLEILNKPGKLTDSEFEVMKSHVLLAKDLLEKAGDFPMKAMEVVLQHHERYDGRGYPSGLIGNQIDLFGRIASIVDVYDAISSDRIYRNAMPPHEAIKRIYEWSATDFERSLVEHFIKAIGIYPVGSLVEINRSDVGMVVSTSQKDALKPVVLLLFDSQKQKYKPPRLIDLTEKDPVFHSSFWSVSKVLGSAGKEILSAL